MGWEFLLGVAGVLALASAIGGWMFRSVTLPEKLLLGAAGILLFFGVGLWIQLIAIAALGGVAGVQWAQVSRAESPADEAGRARSGS
jgi:TRAP-type uncharacterized transport system fused permease subunit